MNKRQLFRRCVRVGEREGCLIPQRYEASALEKFNVSAHPGCVYCPGCAGITLDFFTDAPEISFRCSVLNELPAAARNALADVVTPVCRAEFSNGSEPGTRRYASNSCSARSICCGNSHEFDAAS